MPAAESSLFSSPSLDTWLESAFDFYRREIRPRAQEIDRDAGALSEALQELCARDLMAIRRPMEFGGPELNDDQFFAHQQEIARTSGALAFLTTQHQSAVGLFARTENRALAEQYLPQMGDGRRLVGIGFSQLRRAGPPMLRAQEVDGGYLLDGEVPWVTGAGYYREFVVGAALPSGEAVFGLAPLVDGPAESGGEIRLSPPMRLAAMETANTVTLTMSRFFLARERTLFLRPPGWISHNDEINVSMQGHFALGCAQAGIDIVREAGERRRLPFVASAAEALAEEHAACQANLAAAIGGTHGEGLAGRVWAIDLAVRCAHAGVAASSGAANLLSHPAQRVYREALVYTVSAQTLPIMEATLARLVGR